MAPEVRSTGRVWAPNGGIALALLSIALAEVAAHGLHLPSPVPVILLLLGLAAVAYTAFSAGFAWGAGCAALLALYTLHFLSPRHAVVALTPEVVQGGTTILAIGLGMAAAMAFLRRREEKLRGAIERRHRDLRERNEELTEANAALEAFGYVVSHDLKEPVRAIENYLEAADEEYGTEPGRAYLRTARDANRRLGNMLQGLLAYSRASSATPAPRALDVADVLQADACRAQYEALLRERGGTLHVAPGLPRVLADEVILAQVLGNLLLNAIRHNRSAAPEVRVLAMNDLPASRAHLLVADNGQGFPRDVLKRFASIKATRPGTVKGGFGLVISHRGVQRLGGRMWLANGARGSEVHLDLPAAPEEPPKLQEEADA